MEKPPQPDPQHLAFFHVGAAIACSLSLLGLDGASATFPAIREKILALLSADEEDAITKISILLNTQVKHLDSAFGHSIDSMFAHGHDDIAPALRTQSQCLRAIGIDLAMRKKSRKQTRQKPAKSLKDRDAPLDA